MEESTRYAVVGYSFEMEDGSHNMAHVVVYDGRLVERVMKSVMQNVVDMAKGLRAEMRFPVSKPIFSQPCGHKIADLIFSGMPVKGDVAKGQVYIPKHALNFDPFAQR
jgi:hypothetical protein